jgi:hypothetical protein
MSLGHAQENQIAPKAEHLEIRPVHFGLGLKSGQQEASARGMNGLRQHNPVPSQQTKQDRRKSRAGTVKTGSGCVLC